MSMDLTRKDIQNTITRLSKQISREDSDLTQIRLECDTLSDLIKKYVPFEHEDLGATQNPVLMYDATATIEFCDDGRQILRLAIHEGREPLLVDKHGRHVIDGEDWQSHVDKAEKWLAIDYHITTHEE